MAKTNYHTHHELCRHAVGTAEDYIKEALKWGYIEIGFSDHAPSDVIEDPHPNVRMKNEELSIYISDVKKQAKKYKDKLSILTGLETEYLDPNPKYYEGLLKQVDYLILGQHYVIKENKRKTGQYFKSSFGLTKGDELIQYANSIVAAMKTNYFSFIAHPDLYMCGYHSFDEKAEEAAHIITDAALKYDVPLEFNANGFRRGIIKTDDGEHHPYPRLEFWEIVKSKNCRVILSSDCHEPKLLNDDAVAKAERILKSLKIDVEQTINMKR